MQSQANKKTEVKVDKPGIAKEKKGKGLTVTLFIGDKQIEELTPEQSERMANRLSKTMSSYYSAHPSEYQKIK